MKTYSLRTGDRIVLRTMDRPDGDIVLHDAITVRLEPGSVQVGMDVRGELVSESARATAFLDEIIAGDLQFHIHIDARAGEKSRSVLVCNATGDDPERLEWIGLR